MALLLGTIRFGQNLSVPERATPFTPWGRARQDQRGDGFPSNPARAGAKRAGCQAVGQNHRTVRKYRRLGGRLAGPGNGGLCLLELAESSPPRGLRGGDDGVSKDTAVRERKDAGPSASLLTSLVAAEGRAGISVVPRGFFGGLALPGDLCVPRPGRAQTLPEEFLQGSGFLRQQTGVEKRLIMVERPVREILWPQRESPVSGRVRLWSGLQTSHFTLPTRPKAVRATSP
jgi:hypothetical protein